MCDVINRISSNICASYFDTFVFKGIIMCLIYWLWLCVSFVIVCKLNDLTPQRHAKWLMDVKRRDVRYKEIGDMKVSLYKRSKLCACGHVCVKKVNTCRRDDICLWGGGDLAIYETSLFDQGRFLRDFLISLVSNCLFLKFVLSSSSFSMPFFQLVLSILVS